MQTFNTHALVLRHADWRDTDRMVTLFTPDHGRIDAVARRCRRAKSPLLNASEPFVTGEFHLFTQKERYTIEQAEISESYFPLRTDYDRLRHGAYWLKLLENALQPEEAAPALFVTTLRALAFLAYSDLPCELLTMAYELHFMAQLGMAPGMNRCLSCGAPIDGDARFDFIAGGTICLRCPSAAKKISNGARRIMMKTPRCEFDKVQLLLDRPEWPEASHHVRRYVLNHMHAEKFAPDLIEI